MTSYGTADQALTITLASLGNGAGRESTAVVNSGYDDILIFGRVLVKSGEGTVASGKHVLVMAYGSVDGTDFSGMTTGTDAAYVAPLGGSVVDTQEAFPFPSPIGSIKVREQDVSYKAGPWSLRTAFGEQLPKWWGLVVKNDTGQPLSSVAGDLAFTWQGVTFS